MLHCTTIRIRFWSVYPSNSLWQQHFLGGLNMNFFVVWALLGLMLHVMTIINMWWCPSAPFCSQIRLFLLTKVCSLQHILGGLNLNFTLAWAFGTRAASITTIRIYDFRQQLAAHECRPDASTRSIDIMCLPRFFPPQTSSPYCASPWLFKTHKMSPLQITTPTSFFL